MRALLRGEVRVTAKLGVKPHEVAVSQNGGFDFVPIYGSGGVDRPGTDGDHIEVENLHTGATYNIPLRRAVRPHDIKVGRDGLLYVTAELAQAVFVIDPVKNKVVAEIPTGQIQSHNIVLSPDGRMAFTANVGAGTVSILSLKPPRLVGIVPVAPHIQRLSVSPDGKRVYTHPQDSPQVAVIDVRSMKLARPYRRSSSCPFEGTAISRRDHERSSMMRNPATIIELHAPDTEPDRAIV